MRTALTMLGIIIGVGAVICTVAIGEGASNQVQEQIRNLGDNMVFVAAGSVSQGGVRLGSAATKTLTLADAKAIQQQIPSVARLSSGVGARVQVVYGNQNWSTRVSGVAPEYLEIRRWPVINGGAFSRREVDSAANVCLIGQTVVENLFGTEDPINKTVRIQNIPFRVIGVLASKGQSPFGQDEDDTVIMPFTTVQRKIAGIDWLQSIMCSAVSPEAINTARQQIAGLLRQRHRLRPDEDDDFIIRSPNDLANAQAQAGEIMTLLLASIASVSLLVGGIGIMNIMLVSVTEPHPRDRRTHGRGRKRAGRAAAIPERSVGVELARWDGGCASRDRGFHSGRQHAPVADTSPSAGHCHCRPVFGRRRNFLWLLSGAQSSAARPDRGAALRVTLAIGQGQEQHGVQRKAGVRKSWEFRSAMKGQFTYMKSRYTPFRIGLLVLMLVSTPMLAPFLHAEGAARRGAIKVEDFFIISSVDAGKKQIVLKRPMEVTELIRVSEKTAYLDEQGKTMEFKSLRAGDTVYVTSSPAPDGVGIASQIRRGPMTLEELHRRYVPFQ
jgi:putative ABC transport system permease protein